MDDTSPIEVPSMAEVVYERLRQGIFRGVYPPGRISIQRLAERFGVSTMPVREALRRLEADGLVSFKSGRQVLVNERSLADLEEIFAIRRELEDLALRTAVPHLVTDVETVAQLDGLVDDMDALFERYDAWREKNHEFHLLLYSASNMPRLCSLIANLGVAVEPYVRLYGTTEEGLRIAQDQHRGSRGSAHRRVRECASAWMKRAAGQRWPGSERPPGPRTRMQTRPRASCVRATLRLMASA